MNKFKFRLDPVYHIRKKEERLTQQLYLYKYQQVLEKQQAINQLDLEKQQLISKREGSIESMKLAYHYAARIDEIVFEEYTQLKVLQESAAKTLNELAKIQQKGKILEKLREKQENLFLEDLKKIEQKELDEFKYRPLFIPKKGDS